MSAFFMGVSATFVYLIIGFMFLLSMDRFEWFRNRMQTNVPMMIVLAVLAWPGTVVAYTFSHIFWEWRYGADIYTPKMPEA